MKKRILILSGYLIWGIPLLAQQAPTNNAPGGNLSGSSNQLYWSRAGNTDANGQNNILGTLWNSPIYTQTNSINRMKLNGSFTASTNQYPIDGYSTWGNTNTTMNTSGYLLLGPDAAFQTDLNQTIYNNRGAYSLLHLNGTAPIQQNGYRPWMKTGITFTDNQDMSYFGLRQVGTALDYTETVLNWSDNVGSLDDDMCFRFTGNSTLVQQLTRLTCVVLLILMDFTSPVFLLLVGLDWGIPSDILMHLVIRQTSMYLRNRCCT